MTSEIIADHTLLGPALATAGKDERFRNMMFDALRQAETHAENPRLFREQVRWPLILSLLGAAKTHRVVLANGLVFEVASASRIEQALLLSPVAHPDHVWEPHTTRLLTALAAGSCHTVVGGAYIGDQVLFLARASAGRRPPGVIHAFEPVEPSFSRLSHNLAINDITNVVTHRLGLWDRSHVAITVQGHIALASSMPVDASQHPSGHPIESVAIDDYVRLRELPSLGLIMLDIEGGEEKALRGARATIARHAPHIVFEIHRRFVDWTGGLDKTSIVRFLTSQGYAVFAIRDFHDNHPVAEHPIEIIPVDRVYLEGPPHGFNVLATTDRDLVKRLGLRLVEDVSPKLLLHGDPALHHPIF